MGVVLLATFLRKLGLHYIEFPDQEPDGLNLDERGTGPPVQSRIGLMVRLLTTYEYMVGPTPISTLVPPESSYQFWFESLHPGPSVGRRGGRLSWTRRLDFPNAHETQSEPREPTSTGETPLEVAEGPSRHMCRNGSTTEIG